MNRTYIETFLGKNVEVVLFDGTTLKGIFHKTREEGYKGTDPAKKLLKNYYFCIPEDSLIFRSSHIKKIQEVM